MNPEDIVLKFVACINSHDPDRLAELMAEDHVFTDSLGQSIRGRENARSGWRGYYAFCPDYWVTHHELFSRGGHVAVFGAAGGTITVDGKLSPEHQWRTPAAWLAVIDQGQIQQWRVYADNKPVYDILARLTAQR